MTADASRGVQVSRTSREIAKAMSLYALLTAALFDIGRLLTSVYIGRQGLESAYGAAASLVTLLI